MRKVMKPTGLFDRRSMFIECHLWVRFCSVAKDMTENTQKPQVQSLTGAFPTLFFSFVLPFYRECPPQIICFSHPALFFPKNLLYAGIPFFCLFHFLSFLFSLLLCVFLCLFLSPSFFLPLQIFSLNVRCED